MKNFKSIKEIISYAQKNDLVQIFDCPSWLDETQLIGKYKNAEVRTCENYGYLEVIGLNENDSNELNKSLGSLNEILKED